MMPYGLTRQQWVKKCTFWIELTLSYFQQRKVKVFYSRSTSQFVKVVGVSDWRLLDFNKAPWGNLSHGFGWVGAVQRVSELSDRYIFLIHGLRIPWKSLSCYNFVCRVSRVCVMWEHVTKKGNLGGSIVAEELSPVKMILFDKSRGCICVGLSPQGFDKGAFKIVLILSYSQHKKAKMFLRRFIAQFEKFVGGSVWTSCNPDISPWGHISHGLRVGIWSFNGL